MNKKLCIEVGNKEEKSIKRKYRPYNSWQEYEQQRKEHFAKWGWKCLIFFADKITDKKYKFEKSDEQILKELGVKA